MKIYIKGDKEKRETGKNYTFVTGLKRLVIAGSVAAMVTASIGSVWGRWSCNCKRSYSQGQD